ncbi:hypothetical protein ABK040_002109 [Willaertia magna]
MKNLSPNSTTRIIAISALVIVLFFVVYSLYRPDKHHQHPPPHNPNGPVHESTFHNEKQQIPIEKCKKCLPEITPPPRRFDNKKVTNYNPFTNRYLQSLHFENSQERMRRFQTVYQQGQWNGNSKDIPGSGSGSTREYTIYARHAIQTVVKAYGIKKFIDAPCGDAHWAQLLFPFFKENNVEYLGVDIVPELIESHKRTFKQEYEGTVDFLHMDLAENVLPKGDVIFCRQALQHLNPGNVLKTLHNFCKSGAKYLMTTIYLTGTQQDNELKINGPHNALINLLAPPYSLVEPIAMFVDGSLNQKQYLGLWELPLEGCFDYDYNPNRNN